MSLGEVLLSLRVVLATLLDQLDFSLLRSSPVLLVVTAFQIWMLIDAVRQGEWIWAVFIFVGWGFSALLYYFLVYRVSSASGQGFELPGTHRRQRIKELQAQIHHLDKAHHHAELGDVYFQQGKYEKAEACYRAALERDPQDIDTRAHFGQCLLRRQRPAEAKPLLQGVIAENPNHDYGFTQMALAETLGALGQLEEALAIWKQVTESHAYARAKVLLAELYLHGNQLDLARGELRQVLEDDPHAPAFQRKRDRVWVRRAKRLLAGIK